MGIISTTKKSSLAYSISLSFKEGFSLENCFMFLFQSILVERLNGAYFFGKEEGNIVNISLLMPSANHMNEILQVLKSTPDFINKLDTDDIELIENRPYNNENSLGLVSNGKIRGNKKLLQPVLKGYELSKSNPMYEKSIDFTPQICSCCGSDLKWQAYCPKCNAQQKKLKKEAYIFIIAVLALNTMSFISLSTNLYYALQIISEGKVFLITTLIIDLFRSIGYIASSVLLFRYKIKGFWLYAGLRTFDICLVIFNLVFYQNMSSFISVISAVAWFIVSWILIRDDIDYMA